MKENKKTLKYRQAVYAELLNDIVGKIEYDGNHNKVDIAKAAEMRKPEFDFWYVVKHLWTIFWRIQSLTKWITIWLTVSGLNR